MDLISPAANWLAASFCCSGPGNVLKKLKGSDEERKKGERKGRKGNGNEDIDNKMSALRE